MYMHFTSHTKVETHCGNGFRFWCLTTLSIHFRYIFVIEDNGDEIQREPDYLDRTY